MKDKNILFTISSAITPALLVLLVSTTFLSFIAPSVRGQTPIYVGAFYWGALTTSTPNPLYYAGETPIYVGSFNPAANTGRPRQFISSTTPIPLHPNFNVTRYLGTWYEIYRTKNLPFETGSHVTAEYTLNDTTQQTVSVVNKQWLAAQNRWDIMSGQAWAPNPTKEPAHLVVQFPNLGLSDYRVLTTDYTGIAVVYSEVTYMPGITAKFGWILSRKPTLDESMTNFAFATFLERTGLSQDAFEQTLHGISGTTTTFGTTLLTLPPPILLQPLMSVQSARGPSLFGKEKCAYSVMPSASSGAGCGKLIGVFIVYDAQSGSCGLQTTGCSADLVEPYAFRTVDECKSTCMTSTATMQPRNSNCCPNSISN